MGIFGALVLAMTVNAGPVEVKTAPVFNPTLCAKKRVDACGCHHVYGVRHCHVKRQTGHCEGVVQADAPAHPDSWVEKYLSAPKQSSETQQATASL